MLIRTISRLEIAFLQNLSKALEDEKLSLGIYIV